MDNRNNSPKLPKDWVWTRLGEVCLDPQYGWTTSAIKEGKLKLLRTTDITSGNIDWKSVPFCKKEPPEKEKYLLKDGDIVISRAGSVGYSNLIKNPKEVIFASYLIRFRPLTDEKYIAYFLKSPSYWKSISEKKLGITTPNVNATKLKQISVPLPPLPEQHRIVAKIEELFTKLDAGIEALKKIKKQLKCYRQSVLKYAFKGKLTEEWREKHLPAQAGKGELEPVSVLLERIKEERKKYEKKKNRKSKKLPQLDTSNLPELPEGWVWTRLGEICLDPQYGWTTSAIKDGKLKLLRTTDITSGNIDWDSVPFCKEEPPEKEKYLLKDGDIVISRAGSVGYSNLIKNPKEVIFASYLIRFRTLTDEQYISYFLKSPSYWESISEKILGIAIPNVNASKLKQVLIPLPPLLEQKKIVEEIEHRFSITDEIEKVVEQSLQQSKQLRQSILKKAFEGKLVPQDPTDEPAEKLLERITCLRAKMHRQKKEKNSTKTFLKRKRKFPSPRRRRVRDEVKNQMRIL